MIVDFESKFREYIKGFQAEQALEDDELDEVVPDLYLKWLDEPKEWLENVSPNAFFARKSAADLIESLGLYIIGSVTLPGALLNRIADTKEETYPFLINLLTHYEGEKSDEVKTEIVSLIEEMDFEHPYEYYLSVIAEADEKNDFAEACADELRNADEQLIGCIVSSIEEAKNDYVSDCLLDVLCDLPHDDRTYQLALEKFLYSDKGRAFYASCLGKLGDDRALTYLEESLKQDDLDYYDYSSIKNAFEALGGDIDIERDFTGDKDYESLKDIDNTGDESGNI